MWSTCHLLKRTVTLLGSMPKDNKGSMLHKTKTSKYVNEIYEVTIYGITSVSIIKMLLFMVPNP